ncbi:MAG: alanine--tRNA ligase [Thermotogae bacterium]|nr:alanine--tRNA ligase [Thermotogota bacterium]
MKYMSSEEIRSSFLEFFRKKDHKILPSASLVPNDPQLLFTVAGMVPFKPVFWGKVEPVYPRVATCQKCLRTVDIENVGKTPRHHTFFEMLGNFSFGDYFKKEAIQWAWEYVTQILGIPEDRLWVSVYEEDEESYSIWKDVVGVPEYKIVRMGKEDNFWGPAGPTGPCGPDSEIFYDTGVTDECPDPSSCSPACDCGRFLEIWNLVFTELYKDDKGEYHPLPRKNIDTGAGLERIAAVMQGKTDNFATDLFAPIMEKISSITGVVYGGENDVAMRVIADHSRAIAFVIGEGVFPSNEGRGYVLRRLIRRAQRYGYLLGMRKPFVHEIVASVVEKMGGIYPELVERKKLILDVTKAEEERFLRTLERGSEYFEKIASEGFIKGDEVFKLYDTFGFPVDLTLEMAKERGIEVDMEGFEKLMKMQRERARKARGEREFAESREIYVSLSDTMRTQFTGYEKLEDEGKVEYLLHEDLLVDELVEGERGELFFRSTPFYPEKGGQVADTGRIMTDTGEALVHDVRSVGENLITHVVEITRGKISKGQTARLRVDECRRRAIMRNHTATHLLHAALRKVLGEHVKQAGSLVAPDRLRFDFTHHKPLNREELVEVENMVNLKILEDIPVVMEEKGVEEALQDDVIALFEEKYGDVVRVVKIGNFSAELCGGTHVERTGQIGLFKIVSESSISSGVRRIEALTGLSVLNLLRDDEELLRSLSEILEVRREEVIGRVEKIISENRELLRKLKQLEGKTMNLEIDEAVSKAQEFDGVKMAWVVFEGKDAQLLRNASDTLLSKLGKGVGVVFNRNEGSVSFVVRVSKELVDMLHAGKIAAELAKILGGGGGGRPDFAQAGGKKPEKIPEAVNHLERMIRSLKKG